MRLSSEGNVNMKQIKFQTKVKFQIGLLFRQLGKKLIILLLAPENRAVLFSYNKYKCLSMQYLCIKKTNNTLMR